jgi:Protein of unknown function (DUF3298)
MNQIRTVLIALASAAVITGAAGCGTSSASPPTTPAAPSSPATTAPAYSSNLQSGCDGLGGTVDADQTCHVQSSSSNYTLEMRYPLDYPDQTAVTDFLTQDRADFLDWIAKFGPNDSRGRPYMYAATAKTYRSGMPTAGTASLVVEIDNDTGLANEGHPDTMFKSFNYDLTKNAPITFDTLFKSGTQPLQVLNPIVQRELLHGSDYRVSDLDVYTYQNFAITDEAVIFFFGQNQIVRDHTGPHQVSVPRTELAPLLA